MNAFRNKLTGAAASLCVFSAGFIATPAEAGPREDLVRLVHRLDNYVSDLRKEMTAHFSHTGAYRHMVADANSMIRKVQHIDELSHDPYTSRRHIEADLAELDKLAHHFHDLVDDVDSGRYGHTHGDTRHVHSLLSAVTNTVHAMQDILEDLGHRGYHDDYHDDHDHGYDNRAPRGIRFDSDNIRRIWNGGYDPHRH